jgi:hypothetical protein
LAPIPTPLSIPDPKTRLQFSSTCFFPVKLVSSPRRPPGSLRAKARATINDGFVTEEAAAGLSFYELLGIPESGSLVEIKQAYKQLARKYHPDVSPPGRVDEYTKRFILVQEAYEILSDPRRRALYDRDMAKGLQLAFSARRYYESDEVCVSVDFFFFRQHNCYFAIFAVVASFFFFFFCEFFSGLNWVFEILFNWFNF